nr:protein IWS1 homolog A-like [Aedes albopictus]
MSFYYVCGLQVEAIAADVANAENYNTEMINGNSFEEFGHVNALVRQLRTSEKQNKNEDSKRKTVKMNEEHRHYGIDPILEKAFNDTFGYQMATDDLRSTVKNDIEDEAYNRVSSHEQDLLGIRRTVPGWNGESTRRQRVSDNGNKDHQNNNETDETDDYEYKIANQDGPLLPPLSSSLMSSERADSAEINDMVVALGQRSTGERKTAAAAAKVERKSTLGWLKRKLFSIEGDSVADDRDDDNQSDYKVDRRRRAGYASEFPRRRGPYRNEGDDYPNKHGDPAGDDYYHQSDDSHADISDLGPAQSNRYTADVGGPATYWNKANRERESVQDVGGRVDGRNGDKAREFNRRRKSAKPVGGEMPSSEGTSNKQETTADQQTVYRQQYDDSDQVERTTPCDCAAKCATENSITSESPEEAETTESGEVTEEESTDETAEEPTENEQPPPEEEKEGESDEDESTTEGSTEESETKPDLDHQKEVYIDLKIGIKSVGNQSSPAQDEPIEFHKKIVVKRDELDNNMSSKLTSSLAPASNFPVDLVKAIYQLVDKDDSLRKHVAPRLPDRTKLLSKLEQPGHRQKINDPRREESNSSSAGESSDSKAVAKIEDNTSSNKALASVIEAIGELIRKRT